MRTPHKHAELIKAWADGAEIEFYDTRFNEHRWKLTGPFPYWQPEVEFRIKPEPKPDLRLFYWVSDHLVQCSSKIHMHNLALTFDGDTGVLKSAEVI